MYLLDLAYENARLNATNRFPLMVDKRTVAKWVLLDGNERSRELLRLIALSCSSPPFLNCLPFSFTLLRGAGKEPLRVTHLRLLHDSTDVGKGRTREVTGGVRIESSGEIRPAARLKGDFVFEEAPLSNPLPGAVLGRDFLLAYGDAVSTADFDSDFGFSDPLLRTRRFHSLFCAAASVTDPAAFLARLFHNGSKYKRFAPLHALRRICRLLCEHFDTNVDHWLYDPGTATQEWRALPVHLQQSMRPLLDAVRHVLDAFPKERTPLDLPGVILADRPDRYCSNAILPVWLAFFDRLFPNMQFFVSMPESQHRKVSGDLLKKELLLPVPQKTTTKQHRSSSADVLLIDVDSRLPNLALMKLSRQFKEQGRKVMLARGSSLISGFREVYASCVFTSPASSGKVDALRNFYGDSLQLGGSGIDPRDRLPATVEALPPDYGLYPELGDRAIGFLTRGCPRHCPFCVVPLKEGPPRQVSDLDTLIEGGRLKKLILLDDNLLSLPQSEEILAEIVSKEIPVNFNQGLDLRFVDRGKAALLRRSKSSNTRFTRSNYYFALNDNENFPAVQEKYGLFGFSRRDNVEFLCMYGFNTTLAEDVERFRFLRTLPGAYAFVQQYQPVPGGPPPDMARFFQGDPDRSIDELIRIEFTQNMKSMEKYYRWVSKAYAEAFGRLHMPLVDTIFRYNLREKKGRYIATRAGLDR